MASQFCAHCGRPLKAQARICLSCGAPISGENPGGEGPATTGIHRVKSPEELEVERLLVEVEARKQRVADLEVELKTSELELARFQAEIDRRFGPLYTELDHLNLRHQQYEARIQKLKRSGKQANPRVIEEELTSEFEQGDRNSSGRPPAVGLNGAAGEPRWFSRP